MVFDTLGRSGPTFDSASLHLAHSVKQLSRVAAPPWDQQVVTHVQCHAAAILVFLATRQPTGLARVGVTREHLAAKAV